MAWFGRKSDDDESIDPQVLLAKANAAPPFEPEAATVPAGPFRLTVEDVFTIRGRGTVVTGKVETGSVHKGDSVRLTRQQGSTREVKVDGVEMFRKVVDTAQAGDIVGLLVRGLGRDDIGRGDVLSN